MMYAKHASSGYILLLSILVIGAMSSAVVASMLLLGTDQQRTAAAVQRSGNAIALSQACAEIALHRLRNNPSYTGDETVTVRNGQTCEIYTIGGIGNENRIICTEATDGTVRRRIEIIVASLLPITRIYSWQEVPSFSLCL